MEEGLWLALTISDDIIPYLVGVPEVLADKLPSSDRGHFFGQQDIMMWCYLMKRIKQMKLFIVK